MTIRPAQAVPLVIAHRGASADHPENTPIAFAAALSAGVAGIELDVRLSRDGVPLICHDATLARFGGDRRSLRTLTAAQIRRQDVGTWKGATFAGERVPTLDDALVQCRRVITCIELKATGGRGRRRYHQRLVGAVVRAIISQRALKRVMILCFDGGVLGQVAQLEPRLKRVRNCARMPGDLERWLADQEGLYAACFDRRIVTRQVVDRCHAQGVQVFAWSANHAAAAKRLRECGVDAILSDRPAWLQHYVTI